MNSMIRYSRWRSILVRSAGSQEGPKNPFKGTTVKPLVPASYAQCGVGAGGRRNCAYGCGAIFNGMKTPTLPPWRPACVQSVLPKR